MSAVNLKKSEPGHVPGGVPSAHVDQFARKMLPPKEYWPVFDFSGENLTLYPDYVNAAGVLLDTAVTDGYGDKIAFYYEGESWTYRHLQDRVERIAHVLVEDYGLVPGNRVLLRSMNNPMLAACWLAVLKAGGICVTTVPMLKPEELSFVLNRVEIRFTLCEESLAEDLEAARTSAPTLEKIAYFTPMGTGPSKTAELDRAVMTKPAGFRSVETAADDIAVISFTSGTTGNPKATAHFHRALLAICDCFPPAFTVTEEDIICGSPTMAFTYGLAVLLIYPLRYRASVVLVPKPTPENILDAIEQYSVTSLYCVPTSYNQLLGAIGKFNITSLRKCASSGENLQTPLWERWHDKTGIRIVNGFGATELICTFLSDSMSVDRVGSTGRPVPGYTVELLDKKGQLMPPNARGRLAVRGPTGCLYLDDLEQQKAFVHDGWNVTSDVFVKDGDGYFWFVDRVDDMIVSSGYNISPQEVERALMEHSMISECAVVGVDNAERGKLVRACVVLHDPQRATRETVPVLQAFVKRRIAPYKYPRDIRFYDELPKTHTGKIQRRRLRIE